MHKYSKPTLALVSIVAVLLLFEAGFSVADDYFEHHEKERNEYHGKKHHGDKRAAQIVVNSMYTEACGGCHWAYAPALLPSRSWENILAALNDHFGNDVVLTDQQRKLVYDYVIANAADTSNLKIGRRISHSLAGAIPGRIVDVPYIVRKHRKIDQSTFSRKSIGSLSNCIACHPSAPSARFDDDDVTIPQE